MHPVSHIYRDLKRNPPTKKGIAKGVLFVALNICLVTSLKLFYDRKVKPLQVASEANALLTDREALGVLGYQRSENEIKDRQRQR